MKEIAWIDGIRMLRRTSEVTPPVFFLHGFLGSADEWQPVVDLMGDVNAAAIDLPGHGKSSTCDERFYSLDGMIELLDLVVDRQGGRVDLVGYSMGGRIALLYAIKRPERVRKLVLESASPGIENEDDRRRRIDLDKSRSMQLRQNGLVSFLRDWYRQPLFASMEDHPGLVKELVEKRSRADAVTISRALTAFSPGRMPACWARLKDLEPKTVFVAGSLDTRYVEIGREAERLDRDFILHIEDGAGHNVHLEKTARFADLLKYHLNTNS